MLFNDFKSIQACIKYETQGNILFCYYYYVCPQKLCHFATGKRFDIFQNYFYSGSVYMRTIRQCTVDARSAS